MGSRWLIGFLAVLVVALTGALALAAFHDGQDSGSEEPSAASGEPRFVSPARLSALAAKAAAPIYWLGERPGSKLELTGPAADATYIRYLGGDAQAGDPRDDFVTVATYAAANGVEEIRQAAGERPRASLERLDGGAVLMSDPEAPKSAYLAFPGEPVQIEIYSPVAGAARQLASGDLLQRVP
jgi:hypothetical protein